MNIEAKLYEEPKIDLGDFLNGSSYKKHPKCKGYYDVWNGDSDCGYNTTLTCDHCKYGVGRKDPEAKCNQI
jgi:hypothetical protein